MDDSIRKRIEELRVKSIDKFAREKYIDAISILEDAWELLPGDKIYEKESFTIVSYILEAAIRLKNKEVMETWIDKITEANPERPDCGEREMWVAKVNYELGNFDKARENFIVANLKSGGRCFTSRDIVYKQFFQKEELSN